MRKYISVVLILVVFLFSACEPFKTINEKELQVITNDINVFLKNIDTAEYYLLKEMQDENAVVVKTEFVCVKKIPEKEFLYEIQTKDTHLQCFFKDGNCYTFDVLANKKERRKNELSDIDFLNTINNDISNISQIFDYKYILEISGKHHYLADKEHEPKNINYSFNSEKLYNDSILDLKYDEIVLYAQLNAKSDKLLFINMQFITKNTTLVYYFGTNLYNDEHETLKERLEFPKDLEMYVSV